MKKEFMQLEDRCSTKDIGFDTLTKDRIRKDEKGRVYLDYGNVVGDWAFCVRLYTGQGLVKALARAASRKKPRNKTSLGNRGEDNEQC